MWVISYIKWQSCNASTSHHSSCRWLNTTFYRSDLGDSETCWRNLLTSSDVRERVHQFPCGEKDIFRWRKISKLSFLRFVLCPISVRCLYWTMWCCILVWPGVRGQFSSLIILSLMSVFVLNRWAVNKGVVDFDFSLINMFRQCILYWTAKRKEGEWLWFLFFHLLLCGC